MRKSPHECFPARSSAAEYLTYIAAAGDDKDSVEMRYEDENIWLTQKMMSVLYGVSIAAINQHIKKIFEDSELEANAVIKKYLTTAADGKSYNTNHYNLQMIIAVGFKVNNERAVQFRKWANIIVKDYTIKGWVMDDERLKNGGTVLTEKYFEKQLEKIREIRMSERKFYQKLQIYMQPLLIMTRLHKLPNAFLRRFRISCITVCTVRQQQRLYITAPMLQRKTWGLQAGTTHQKAKFINRM